MDGWWFVEAKTIGELKELFSVRGQHGPSLDRVPRNQVVPRRRVLARNKAWSTIGLDSLTIAFWIKFEKQEQRKTRRSQAFLGKTQHRTDRREGPVHPSGAMGCAERTTVASGR